MSERDEYLSKKEFSGSKISTVLAIGALVSMMALTGCGAKTADLSTPTKSSKVEQVLNENENIKAYNLYLNPYSEPIEVNVIKRAVKYNDSYGRVYSYSLDNGDLIETGQFGINYYTNKDLEAANGQRVVPSACFMDGCIVSQELDSQFRSELTTDPITFETNKPNSFSIGD